MEFHPFAKPWPLMEGPKFDKLVADIKAYGLRQRSSLYQQKILDGRNRYTRLRQAGVTPRYEPAKVKNDHEALMLSASLNKHRRHMSEDQLAFVASRLANMTQGGNMRNTKVELVNTSSTLDKPIVTVKEAADALVRQRRACK